jgi:acyl-CoA thioesterase I
LALAIDATTRLLFIGDSITEWQRDFDPEGLGLGYVRIIRDFLVARDRAAAPTVINRGVRGDRMPDLQARWQRDVLDLTPDIVSIFVGVNDVSYRLLLGDGGDLESYEMGYLEIIGRTRRVLPNAAIVLCEPTMLRLPDQPRSNEELAHYAAAVRRVAATCGATCVVGLHGVFAHAGVVRPDIAWMLDEVHPSSAGHALIADAWLRATGLIEQQERA